LSERARNSYFFACATIGRAYALRVVKASEAALNPPAELARDGTDGPKG
jgi:hypothetical protein